MGCTEKYAAEKIYDDMFQAIRGLTVQKILKIGILRQNSCKMKAFLVFSQMLRFRLYSKKDTTIYITWHHWHSSNHFISKKIACLLLNSKR